MSEERNDLTRSGKPKSRQQLWAERQNAQGKCRLCNRPLDPTSRSFCAAHLDAVRTRCRTNKGCKPWRPGGPGRPPIRRGGGETAAGAAEGGAS